MKTVNFYVMRHGKKDGDKLTQEGMEQVRRSALANLSGVTLSAALSSEMVRAQQTVLEVLDTLEQYRLGAEIDYGFGYAWFIGDKECPVQMYQLIDRHRNIPNDADQKTVGDVLKVWAAGRAYRHRVTGALLSQAVLMDAQFPDQDEVNVLVGCHSPVAEMAAPIDFPRLNLADIVRYRVTVDNGEPELQITETTHMPCPPAE